MGELRGFDRVTDNVRRRQEYLDGHPSVTITHVRHPRWEWIASWTDQGNRFTLRRDELADLLDALDNLDLPSDGPA